MSATERQKREARPTEIQSGGTDADSALMTRAFELAAGGRGWTSPNPVVGALVVRDGEIVGSGYHERYGEAHAEVNALREAGPLARGATLYVTLEPCCVSGKTPPCTDAVVSAGIARVVVPVEDPNPSVSGRGLSLLRDAGVEVTLGVEREEAIRLNAPYFKFRRKGLPFTTLKLALSLDGRIAAPRGGPRWTSSEESRELVHAMRAQADCVMVGVGTVLADDPRLTDRRKRSEPSGGDDRAGRERPAAGRAAGRQPARLVLDTRLRTPLECAIVTGARDVRSIIACGEDADPSRRSALEDAGVEVWRSGLSDGRLDPGHVLKRAAEEGLISILAEGGATVAGSLLTGDLVDRVALFIAPRLYGPDGLSALGTLDRSWWSDLGRFENVSWSEIGGDCLFEADVVRPGDEDGGA